MRNALIAAAASVLSLALVTGALAQTATPQGGAAPAPSSQQQAQATLPSAFTFTTRRAGTGPGGYTQLCDDPLDPRLFTGECSAAGIGQ
jgi:hypothetical protein